VGVQGEAGISAPSRSGDLEVRRHNTRRPLTLALGCLVGGAFAVPFAGNMAHAQQVFDVTSPTYGADPTGVKDSTTAVQAAINDAQAAGPGNEVYFPAGHYVFFKQISSGTSLTVATGNAVTLQGDGPSASVLSEGVGKNLLLVQADGSVVNQLQLDTQPNAMTSSAQAALVMAASNTLLENSTILGGPNSFAVFYPGPPGATKSNISYDTGNNIDNISIDDQWNRDGFSYSFQENGLVQNVTHTGSRMAIFVDKNIEVDNYTYHPGAQTASTQGFWITAPSDGVTINGFDTYGNGGTIGSGGSPSTNITIKNETYHNGGGFHLSVGEVKGLTVDACNFGTNNELRFIDNHQATGVLVENCSSLPVVRFAQPASAPGVVQATFTNNTYPAFTPIPQQGQQTFININGAPSDFTVNGGTFQNCAKGLFKGSNTTFAVNSLAGYPCGADAAPNASLTLNPSSCTATCQVTADASASTDSDSTPIVDYAFTWGDGTSSGRQASASLGHSYSLPGMYTISVDVIDSAGLNTTTQKTATITVNNLVGNPGFECDCATGWASGAGSRLQLTSTAHSGSFAAQISRKTSAGKGQLQDSPPWNGSTPAGTTCHVSAWVEVPAGLRVNLRTVELHGSTIAAKHTFSVVDSSGGWVQVSGAAAVVNGGDVLKLQIYARLTLGQTLLVDDVVEYCQ
jgi:PKD domain/Pectate lyase superfamily protein